MARLLPGKLPDPPARYNREKFNQIVKKIQQVLKIPVEKEVDADDREALDFFLSK